MIPQDWLILSIGGLIAGVLAGFLGIGGGTLIVPLLVALGYAPVQAIATSSLSIVITALSGTLQNWRMGYFSFKRIAFLAFPAVITAQIGADLANLIPSYILLTAFGLLLLLNIYLVELRKRLTQNQPNGEPEQQSPITHQPAPILNPLISRLVTGGAAGLLAGLFGVGGGIIMVPLQILLLGERIKVAIQTSLGVIIITALSACIGHARQGNVLWLEGIILGAGGLLGAQVGTRYLPRLSDELVSLTFRSMLGILSIYIFWQAWNSLLLSR
jgi:uncharacterized protein